MSSLPPYNPRLGDRAAWLLPVDDAEQLPPALPVPAAGWRRVVVDDPALSDRVTNLCGGALPEVLAEWQVGDPGGDGWIAVIGAPGFVERALRRLMGMPDGTARFVLVPGATTVVQLLPDRAVLVRLNDGHALTELRA